MMGHNRPQVDILAHQAMNVDHGLGTEVGFLVAMIPAPLHRHLTVSNDH